MAEKLSVERRRDNRPSMKALRQSLTVIDSSADKVPGVILHLNLSMVRIVIVFAIRLARNSPVF